MNNHELVRDAKSTTGCMADDWIQTLVVVKVKWMFLRNYPHPSDDGVARSQQLIDTNIENNKNNKNNNTAKKKERNREEEITIQPIKDRQRHTRESCMSLCVKSLLADDSFLSVCCRAGSLFLLSFFFFSASFFIASRRDDRTARELYKCCRRCRSWIFHTLI